MFAIKQPRQIYAIEAGTVPANKNYVTGTVPANKSYVTGTVKKAKFKKKIT